jgi:hypothetical protein
MDADTEDEIKVIEPLARTRNLVWGGYETVQMVKVGEILFGATGLGSMTETNEATNENTSPQTG